MTHTFDVRTLSLDELEGLCHNVAELNQKLAQLLETRRAIQGTRQDKAHRLVAAKAALTAYQGALALQGS